MALAPDLAASSTAIRLQQDTVALDGLFSLLSGYHAGRIHDTLSAAASFLFVARASATDSVGFNDANSLFTTHALVLASTLITQPSLAAGSEQTAVIHDTLLTEDQLSFVVRLLMTSGLVAHETLLGDPQRAVRMAERLTLSTEVLATRELNAALSDDLGLNEAFLYLARLTLGDGFALESTFSADDVARVLRLAETITLAARNAAVLETTVSLAEALVLLAGVDSRYPLSVQEALTLADQQAPTLLAQLSQLETLQFVDSLDRGIAFFAKSADTVALDDSQTATLSALLRHRDVLAFIGRLPLGDEDYQAWVLNSDSLGVTEYTQWPFNSIVDTPRGTFGLTDTGLYELTGDTDDGAPIEASLRTGDLAFNTSAHKRVDSAYLYLASTDDVYIRTISTHRGQRSEAWYRVNYREGADDGQTRRVRFGKGLRGTTWAFELANIDGGDLDLRGAEVLPLKLTRRI
jgi:hypothetical protein